MQGCSPGTLSLPRLPPNMIHVKGCISGVHILSGPTHARSVTYSVERHASMAITLADRQVRLSRKGLAAVRALRLLEQQKDELALKIKKQQEIVKAELDVANLEPGPRVQGTDAKGHALINYKVSVVRSIDGDLLRKRAPEIAEECTVESLRRRMYLAPVE